MSLFLGLVAVERGLVSNTITHSRSHRIACHRNQDIEQNKNYHKCVKNGQKNRKERSKALSIEQTEISQ